MIAQSSHKIQVYTCVMKRKPHSASLVLLLICIFTFWWGISVLSQSTIPVSSSTPAGTQYNAGSEPLLVHESMSGTTRTYSGTFIPNSACDTFGSGIKYSSESGGHVSVLLISKSSSTDCAQAAEGSLDEPFTVSIKLAAGNNPTFDGVFLNGTMVPSQLIKSN